MSQKLWAILAFNIYSLFLLSAFQANTVYLFDASFIKEAKLIDIYISEWGWGDHYIWRLFSSVIVTALAGILTGAIAKKNGSQIAALANIPSILVWGVSIYLFGFSGTEVVAGVGFTIISIIAIPLTTYIAYLAGNLGEQIQQEVFSEHTVLGIKGYHWIWVIYPLYFYATGIVFTGTQFAAGSLLSANPFSITASIIYLLLLLRVFAWVYPLWIIHRILMGVFLDNHSALVRGLAVFGVLIFGAAIAMGIQFGAGVAWLFLLD